MRSCKFQVYSKMSRKEPKRLRFGPEDDLALLKEFINVNPLEDPEKWETIQTNIHIITRKKFLIRTLKDHLFRILEIWLKKDKGNQIMSGVEEIFSERDQLLQEVSDLCNNANVKPITKKRKISKEKRIQELGRTGRDECARTLSVKQNNVCTEPENNENALSSSCDLDYYLIPTIGNEIEISNDQTSNHVEIEPLELALEATAQKSPILNSGIELSPIPEPIPKMPHNEKRILGPKRTRLNKSGPLRRSALEYLQTKAVREEMLQSRQLQLEEEKLNLEKKRINLEQQRQEFEMMERRDRHDMENIRFNQEIFERDQKTKIIEQQHQLIQSLLERLRKYENH